MSFENFINSLLNDTDYLKQTPHLKQILLSGEVKESKSF